MRPTLQRQSPPAAKPQCCPLADEALSQEDLNHYAHIFKALGDPNRLSIISRIAADGCREVTAADLQCLTGTSQATVSHHLAKLQEAGLLHAEREGRTLRYSVVPEVFAQLRTILAIGSFGEG